MTASVTPGDTRPALPAQRPLLACTACRHIFTPTSREIAQLGATGCPRCRGWTWLVSLSAPLASDPVPALRGRDEESRNV